MDQSQSEVSGNKSRRVVFVFGVLMCSAIALFAFAGFAFVLREFFLFDVNRTHAQREVDHLRQIAEDQAKDNITLGEELAKREAVLAARQPNIEEFIALTNRLAIARNDILSTLDDLKRVRDTLGAEQGTLVATRQENTVLAERRLSLSGDLSAKAKELGDSENTLAELKKQIATLRMEREAAQAATDAIKEQFAVEAGRLTNLTMRTEALRKTHQEVERDKENAQTALTALNLKVQTQEANLAVQTAAVEDAERRAVKLKNDLAVLTKEEAATQATADVLKTAVSEAAAIHTNLLAKIKLNRDTLVKTEAERDNARTERDKAAAQVAVAQETIKARNSEKTELEADIADLVKRRQTLETERVNLEKRKRGVESELAALLKQRAEPEKEATP